MQASDVKLGLLLTVRVETFLSAGERRKKKMSVSHASVCPLEALDSTDERVSGVQFLNLALMFL
jgi:hypothetical protein